MILGTEDFVEIVDKVMYEVNRLTRSKEFISIKIEYILLNKQISKRYRTL